MPNKSTNSWVCRCEICPSQTSGHAGNIKFHLFQNMIPILEFLPQKTHCFGKINGQDFKLLGGGMGRPFDGIVRTELKSQMGKIPFPVALLSPVLIMGYPTYSTYHVGAFDLFKLSNGYTYKRHFKFENGNTMETEHEVIYFGDRLEGKFEVKDCELKLPEIISGDLTVETFFPLGKGKLGSHFCMAWHTSEGKLFRAFVESEYTLSHTVTLPYQQFRFIRFETEVSEEHITQIERLNVIRELNKLNLDIVNKTYSLII